MLLIGAGQAHAVDCSVPGDEATIQDALDNATCDTVIVGAGTFNESLDLPDRDVTIRGQGIDTTIVDSDGIDDVVRDSSTNVQTFVLEDLTLTDGGDGVSVGAGANGDTMTLRRVKVTANAGRGAEASGATLNVFDSQISNNTTTLGGAGSAASTARS